jgi:hypothetical protein
MQVFLYCDVQEKRISPKGFFANIFVMPKLLLFALGSTTTGSNHVCA